LQSQDFELFEPATVPKRPVSPKPVQNVVIAGVLGLMFGIFLVFFIEFWKSSKEPVVSAA